MKLIDPKYILMAVALTANGCLNMLPSAETSTPAPASAASPETTVSPSPTLTPCEPSMPKPTKTALPDPVSGPIVGNAAGAANSTAVRDLPPDKRIDEKPPQEINPLNSLPPSNSRPSQPTTDPCTEPTSSPTPATANTKPVLKPHQKP